MKVQAESFHLNGHIIGFCPQNQKLESPYKTGSNTPAVKGLIFFTPLLYFFLDEPSLFAFYLFVGLLSCIT